MEFWSKILFDFSPCSVLEIACGTGRLAEIFLREGIHYTGIDIMTNFIQTAKKKMINYSNNSLFIKGDMRNFNLNKKFDFIFIAFNSFLHLLTDEEIFTCLNCIKNHMHGKSRFIIDIYVPNPLFLYRPSNCRFKVLEFINSKTNEKVYVEETNSYDGKTDINKITWYFSTDEKQDYEHRKFSLRMLFPSKMNHILIDSGFKICNQWGDYHQTKLNVGSKLQIYNLMLH